MRMPRTLLRSPRREAGIALVSVLLLTMIALVLTGALSALMLTGMRGTSLARSGEVSYTVAQAGINTAIFRVEAGTSPATGPISVEAYLNGVLGGAAHAGTYTFTGTVTGGSYTATLSDPVPGDGILTLTAVGTDTASGRSRTLVAILRAEPVSALSYAMFGNKINFHNHNKTNYGVSMNTSMFSNGNIQIDKGVRINGPAQAVLKILPNQGSAPSDTILTPAGEQGDPNPMTTVPGAQVVQVVPAPPIQPFPTFDFYGARVAAEAAGRDLTPTELYQLINAAKAFAATPAMTPTAGASRRGLLPAGNYPPGVDPIKVPINVIRYNQLAGGPSLRTIAVPNADDPNAVVAVGAFFGTGPSNFASPSIIEIQFTANPLVADNLLYVTGPVALNDGSDNLLQIQGGLVVNGSITVNMALELLAWHNRTGNKVVPLGGSLYVNDAGNSSFATTAAQVADPANFDLLYSNWPAIAANGAIKLSDSGPHWGGPVHIEGLVYTVAESHFHKSLARESSYAVGGEVAETIHNCQFFSFAYDPQVVSTRGLYSKVAGRVKLDVIRLEDRN
jgi:hypothetical protein